MGKQPKELSPEEQRARLLEYMADTVRNHIANYGEDHPITLDAKQELEDELAKTPEPLTSYELKGDGKPWND